MATVIKPYESVGEFVFGESLENIQKKLGKVNLLEDYILNNKTEYRLACEFVYEEDKLVYVVCLKDSQVELNGVRVFETSIDTIKEMDSDFIEGKGYIVFRNLGVCIGGMLGKPIPKKGKVLIAFDKKHLVFFESYTKRASRAKE